MKEVKCILSGHHDNVGEAIMEMDSKVGDWTCTRLLEWREHSITINHYLLFEKGE